LETVPTIHIQSVGN